MKKPACKKTLKKVQAEGIPRDTPVYSSISEGSDIDAPRWAGDTDRLSPLKNSGKYIHFACGHYLHHYRAELIAKEVSAFIKGLL